ncbi:MAG TPA: response regulator [Methylocella sp.]|nr:response regulator [Methylocella sp.]
MNYCLNFVGESGRAEDVWEANFDSEHAAICWMWIAGGTWAVCRSWSFMELWCRRCSNGQGAGCPRFSAGATACCIARVPASVLKRARKPHQAQRRRPLVLIVERNAFVAMAHHGMVTAAGCLVGATFSEYASAGRWLRLHSPDAVILDIEIQDRGCAELARRLLLQAVPVVAVSSGLVKTAAGGGALRSIPWLQKPVTSAGLQLALRSMI